MFRAMRRKKQQLPMDECLEILRQEPRGVLSVLGDDDYPYGLPIDFWYCEEDGRIYLHCAKSGHKLDAIARHDKVSFCVYDQGFHREGEWALNIRSVIVFGRAELVQDQQQTLHICRQLCYKFTEDEEYIEREINSAGARVQCVAIIPEHISGKLVNES